MARAPSCKEVLRLVAQHVGVDLPRHELPRQPGEDRATETPPTGLAVCVLG
jgi:hypothetical protein